MMLMTVFLVLIYVTGEVVNILLSMSHPLAIRNVCDTLARYRCFYTN
jgi:hypothetical protein